jgi:hypothetical protein
MGCVWWVLAAAALHDKVNKEKTNEHQNISALSHTGICGLCEFLPPMIMTSFIEIKDAAVKCPRN